MADTVEEQRANLLRAVGECITTWAAVERSLSALYCECVGSPIGAPDFWLHASIFDSVISIDTRLDMIQAALERNSGTLKPKAKRAQHLLDWKKLRAKIRRKYTKRNEVAHSDVSQSMDKDGSTLVRLLAYPTLTTGGLDGNQTFLDVKQLRERTTVFDNLGGEIGVFRDRTRAVLTRLPKSL